MYGVLARVAMGPGNFGQHSHRMNIAEADGKRYVSAMWASAETALWNRCSLNLV